MGKIKSFIFGRVILKKVMMKWVKHATGYLVAFMVGVQSAPWFITHAQPLVDQSPRLQELLSKGGLEEVIGVVIAGLFGAAFNFIEHRWVKK